MFRNLKALGLLVFAALAMSATFAAGAQGQTHEETTLFGTLTSGTVTSEDTKEFDHEKVDLHGEQNPKVTNYFEAFGQKVECTVATYEGTANGTTTEVTLTPTYKECFVGNLPATVNMTGCDYIFTHPKTIEPLGTGKYTGKADLTCPKGKHVDIDVFGSGNHTEHSGGKICELTVFATGTPTGEGEEEHTVQELGGHIIYQNGVTEAGWHDITAEATVEGISATRKGLCSFGIHQTTNAGKFFSTVTLEATRDVAPEGSEEETTEPRDLWLSDPGGE